MYTFDFHADQILGGREDQQDRYAFHALAGNHLLAVLADGASGHPCGDHAAQLAVDTVAAQVQQALARDPAAPIAPILKEAAHAAHAAFFEYTARVRRCRSMISTLIAACVHPDSDRLHYAYVGDSLLFRQALPRVELICEPHNNGLFITSALGLRLDELRCPPEGIPIRPGDRFLLASDGLDVVTPPEVAAILARAADSREAVRDLLTAVNGAGKPYQDNTTVMALFVGGEGA